VGACEDYRAVASVDLDEQREERGRGVEDQVCGQGAVGQGGRGGEAVRLREGLGGGLRGARRGRGAGLWALHPRGEAGGAGESLVGVFQGLRWICQSRWRGGQ
jgi:hypothetical protein